MEMLDPCLASTLSVVLMTSVRTGLDPGPRGVDDDFGLALLVVDLEPDGNKDVIDNRNSLSRVLSNE